MASLPSLLVLQEPDMAIRGLPLTVTYTAWDTSANKGKLGDVSHHTLKLVRDGAAPVAPTNSPLEAANGEYDLSLTGAEMGAAFLAVCGTSSTANVVILPVKLTTLLTPPLFLCKDFFQDANGIDIVIHEPNLGGLWTPQGTSLFFMIGNRLQYTAIATGDVCMRDLTQADSFQQITVNFAGNTGNDLGLIARADLLSNPAAGWMATLDQSLNQFQIRNLSTLAVAASLAFTPNNTRDYILQILCSGTSVTATVIGDPLFGPQVLSVTDNTFKTNTIAGFASGVVRGKSNGLELFSKYFAQTLSGTPGYATAWNQDLADGADGLLDLMNGIEDGWTTRQVLRLIAASAAGKLSGALTPTVTIRDLGDTKNRIRASVDGVGNRTGATYDVS